MKGLLLLILAMASLVLPGCATEAYYNAAQADLALKLAKVKARAAAQQKARERPLVDFSWTDQYGVDHKMVVNQPAPIYLPPPAMEPQRQLAAPWEGGYLFFDRTLSTVERFLPWILGGGNTRDSGNTSYSYQFGDGAYFQQSRDYSPVSLTQDSSTAGNPAE